MLSIVMNVLFQNIPDNATSKYKLILLYITVNALKHISAEQTLTHTILGLHFPLLPLSLQYPKCSEQQHYGDVAAATAGESAKGAAGHCTSPQSVDADPGNMGK